MRFLLTFKNFSLSIEPTAGDRVTIWLHSRLRVSKHGSRDSSRYVIFIIMILYVQPQIVERTTGHFFEIIGVEVPASVRHRHEYWQPRPTRSDGTHSQFSESLQLANGWGLQGAGGRGW